MMCLAAVSMNADDGIGNRCLITPEELLHNICAKYARIQEILWA
jgi:hypothetical protein